MYLYFLSTPPCAVKYNGEYIGRASENYSVYPCKKGLYEFIPLAPFYEETYFLWEEKQLNDNKNIKIIDLYGGFLIIPSFSRRAFADFKELFFKTEEVGDFQAEIQVYVENGVKISMRCGKNKLTEGVPFLPAALNLEKAYFCGKGYILAFLSDKKTAAYGFELSNDGIRTIFKRPCDGYSASADRVILTETKNDILKHTVTTRWSFSDGVKIESAEIRRGKEPYSLPEKLLPYAFFEELKLGKTPTDFLAPGLRPRAEDVKAFAGNFVSVLPPPHFKPNDYVTLLYEDKAEYAKLNLSARLIDNITITSDGI